MPVTEPFRITPNLGPDLYQTGDEYYWAEPSGIVSYQLGVTVKGNDGHDYTHVTAGADFEAGDGVDIDEETWVAESGSSHTVVSDVKEGEAFHARKATL